MFCLLIVLNTLSDTHDQYKLRFHITEDVVCYNLFFKKLNKALTINFTVIKNVIKIQN